jgi:hypothetical protein
MTDPPQQQTDLGKTKNDQPLEPELKGESTMSDIGDIDTLLAEYAEAEHLAAKSGVLADYDRANAIRAKIDAAVALLRDLCADAERYRWLSAGNECRSLPSGRYTVWSGELNANFDGDSLGEAIDASRSPLAPTPEPR